MFKDYDKYLSTSLKVYLFVLTIIFILKIVGLDYFGIDVNNSTIKYIDGFCFKYHLQNVWYYITLYLNAYVYVSLTNKKNDRNVKIYCVLITLTSILLKYIQSIIANALIIYCMDFLYLIIICISYNRFKEIKVIIKKTIKLLILNTCYQLITLFIRNINYIEDNSFIINTILSLDHLLLLLITQKVYFMKGDVKICGMEVSLSSLKKINLKNLLKKLQKNWHNFKKQEKVTKLTIIIYTIFSLIWNTLSVVIILLVAKLNDTLVECIFILTSFWLSKRSFGKAFHLSSMMHCFIVSNLSYYALNRLTTPLGISIIIPILLGVGLSYVTSKLVKKTYKPLYKGMPEDLFEETILKVTDKNSVKYKICYDFYIKNKTVVSLALKYNYSEAGIRKIKDRINDKIKRLD